RCLDPGRAPAGRLVPALLDGEPLQRLDQRGRHVGLGLGPDLVLPHRRERNPFAGYVPTALAAWPMPHTSRWKATKPGAYSWRATATSTRAGTPSWLARRARSRAAATASPWSTASACRPWERAAPTKSVRCSKSVAVGAWPVSRPMYCGQARPP